MRGIVSRVAARHLEARYDPYALRDVEFYTRLRDEVLEFQRKGRWSNAARRLWLQRPFFQALKDHAPAKYQKAVSEFVGATEPTSSEVRVASRLPKYDYDAVEREIKRRIRDDTATTSDRIEYYTVLKPRTYALPAPPYMWHETDLESAKAILREGFVLGATSNRGEASLLVYGHPPDVVRQRNRSNYVRGGGVPAYLKINLQGLRLLNIDTIPYDPDAPPGHQLREGFYVDEVMEKGTIPEGYEGIFRPDQEVAISAQAATARVEPVIYGRSGRPIKVNQSDTPTSRVAARHLEAKYDPYAPQSVQDVWYKHIYTVTLDDGDDLNLDVHGKPTGMAALMNRARKWSADEFTAYMERDAGNGRIGELRKSLDSEPLEYRIMVRGKVKGKGNTSERDLPNLREYLADHYKYAKWAGEMEIVTRPRPKSDYRKLDALLAARAEREQAWAKLYADLRTPQPVVVDGMTSSDTVSVFVEDRGVRVGGLYLSKEDSTSNLEFTGCEEDIRKLVAEFGDGPVWTVPKSTLWPEYRGKGMGMALYLRGVELLRSMGNRPVYLEAHHCLRDGRGNVFGTTSEDALRVWKKLSSRFPSSGTVIAIV